jgi:hypothetical protein
MAIGTAYTQTPGEWVWLHGDSISNNPGNFGIQGVPSATNYPPSLYEACEWTDNSGNFWLWGGLHPTPYSVYSDLWKYNPLTNEWTWIKGPGTANPIGNYGVQGVPSTTNYPPCSSYGVNSWVDLNGNLWMFGGGGFAPGIYSDLWKYDIGTNEWTWMKGPGLLTQPGVYGTIGIPDPFNNPPPRSETAASWTDSYGDLWLFGGTGYNSPYPDYNDMWRFNISSNNWTWMNGSSVPDQPSVYGTKGIENSANTPGARWAHTKWKDNNGNFWIYGGREHAIPLNRNDLWRFNPLTNKWTWMNGDTVGNVIGENGTQCVGSPLNFPMNSVECRATWTDSNGNLWALIFGYGIYNSLWMYCHASEQWAIIKADSLLFNAYPVWGTKGVSSPSTIPMGLQGPIGWTDHNAHLYLFGGWWGGGIWSNALWMYTIDPCCTACNIGFPVQDFSASDTTICPGTCLNLINNSQYYSGYHWQFPGANPTSSNLPNPQNICYTNPGMYDVTLIANGCNAIDTLTFTNYITVYPSPSPQGITQNSDTLFAIAGAASYQWYFNGNIINGATDYNYVAQSSGDYNVIATDINGCEVEAVINNVIAGNSQLAVGNWEWAIYPDPVGETLSVNISTLLAASDEISIYNMVGEMVLAVPLQTANCQLPTCSIDVSSLRNGMYYIQIIQQEKIFQTKFIKQ